MVVDGFRQVDRRDLTRVFEDPVLDIAVLRVAPAVAACLHRLQPLVLEDLADASEFSAVVVGTAQDYVLLVGRRFLPRWMRMLTE